MRRLFAISLVLVLALPLASSLFGLQAADGALPACCRRDGRHHCSMPVGESTDGTQPSVSMVGEKCPCVPATPAMLLHLSFTPSTAAAVFAGVTRHPAIFAQTQVQLRVSFDRARQKRGPPLSA